MSIELMLLANLIKLVAGYHIKPKQNLKIRSWLDYCRVLKAHVVKVHRVMERANPLATEDVYYPGTGVRE